MIHVQRIYWQSGKMGDDWKAKMVNGLRFDSATTAGVKVVEIEGHTFEEDNIFSKCF